MFKYLFNNSLLSGETNFELDAGQYGDGQYYVRGVTSDGCLVSSDTVNFIKVLVGIQGIYEGFELKVYPNPVHRDVTIHPNFNINKKKLGG